jgi:hypothetical protein
MDRVEAARGRLIELKAELASPAVTSPCVQCRHYAVVCTHPAVAKITINPETGAVSSSGVDARNARANDGLCGPEGALWEARSLPAATMIAMLQTTTGKMVAIVSFGLVVSWLGGLIGL